MKKKLILASALSTMMIGAVPAFAASDATLPTIQQTAGDQHVTMLNGEQPPEPPKDADGNPLPPPNIQQDENGNQPPEPPKDTDGNPLPPPDMQQRQNNNRPPEPPKDADGNPLPPPNMQQGQGTPSFLPHHQNSSTNKNN